MTRMYWGEYCIIVQMASAQVSTSFVKYPCIDFIFYKKEGIGALPNFVRPFHHSSLRTFLIPKA